MRFADFANAVLWTAMLSSAATEGARAADAAALLSGTAWHEVNVLASLDDLTPEKRREMQACTMPSYSFEMQGNSLVKREVIGSTPYKTVYAKVESTRSGPDTKIDLYWRSEDGGDGIKPNETFVLEKGGQTLKATSKIFNNGAVKCTSVQTPIPEPVVHGGRSSK